MEIKPGLSAIVTGGASGIGIFFVAFVIIQLKINQWNCPFFFLINQLLLVKSASLYLNILESAKLSFSFYDT